MTIAKHHFRIECKAVLPLSPPVAGLLIFTESLRSTTTVSVLTSVFIQTAALLSRSRTRSRSVTIHTLTVSPFSFRSTVTVVTSLNVSLCSTTKESLLSVRHSSVVLSASLVRTAVRLVEHPDTMRAINTITSTLLDML